MRASDLSTHPLVSRRAVLGVASLILLGGCTSAAEQAHQRFFAAVKADPLFTWRPDWTTTDLFIRYLRPIKIGPARAVARILRTGKRSVVVQVDIYRVDDGELAATSTVNFAAVG